MTRELDDALTPVASRQREAGVHGWPFASGCASVVVGAFAALSVVDGAPDRG